MGYLEKSHFSVSILYSTKQKKIALFHFFASISLYQTRPKEKTKKGSYSSTGAKEGEKRKRGRPRKSSSSISVDDKGKNKIDCSSSKKKNYKADDHQQKSERKRNFKRKKESTDEDEDLKPKQKMKKKENKIPTLRTRTAPTALYSALSILSAEREKVLIDMGFGGLIGMKIHDLPGFLGYHVISKFDDEEMKLPTSNGPIEVTEYKVHEIMGIPKGGVSIDCLEERKPNDPFIKEWFQQFPSGKKDIRPNDITDVIVGSNDHGKLFRMNFLLLFANTIGICDTQGACSMNILKRINDNIIERVLLYLDSTRCDAFPIQRQRPAIRGWKTILMKYREKIEIESGGFGLLPKEVDVYINSLQSKNFVEKIQRSFNNINLEMASISSSLKEGLSRFPLCDSLKKLLEEFKNGISSNAFMEEDDGCDDVDDLAENYTSKNSDESLEIRDKTDSDPDTCKEKDFLDKEMNDTIEKDQNNTSVVQEQVERNENSFQNRQMVEEQTVGEQDSVMTECEEEAEANSPEKINAESQDRTQDESTNEVEKPIEDKSQHAEKEQESPVEIEEPTKEHHVADTLNQENEGSISDQSERSKQDISTDAGKIEVNVEVNENDVVPPSVKEQNLVAEVSGGGDDKDPIDVVEQRDEKLETTEVVDSIMECGYSDVAPVADEVEVTKGSSEEGDVIHSSDVEVQKDEIIEVTEANDSTKECDTNVTPMVEEQEIPAKSSMEESDATASETVMGNSNMEGQVVEKSIEERVTEPSEIVAEDSTMEEQVVADPSETKAEDSTMEDQVAGKQQEQEIDAESSFKEDEPKVPTETRADESNFPEKVAENKEVLDSIIHEEKTNEEDKHEGRPPTQDSAQTVIQDPKVTLSKDEKIVSRTLFAMTGPAWEPIFKSERGDFLFHFDMETMTPNLEISTNVIDVWSQILNVLELYKEDDRLPSRYFFKISGIHTDEEKLQSFTKSVDESFRNDEKHLKSLETFDILFFPVCRENHLYLICADFKNGSFRVIDNSSNGTDFEERYKSIPEEIKKVLVAYLDQVKHPMTECIRNTKPIRMQMKWRTKNNHVDCGVFLMLHMESYHGLKNWDCGLFSESDKQKRQLDLLRSKYAAKILLSDLNLIKNKFLKLVQVFEEKSENERKKMIEYAIVQRKEREIVSIVQTLVDMVNQYMIKKAYKQALLKFHPDRAPKDDLHKQVEAEETFKIIQRMKERKGPNIII
ncbi:ulp1 protease family, C-terminal catalytic domain-containing protein [Artemisia annua]|uniref:Ulp1 protease family, C-terminal catalytic domain-containing protein n=1 Tax=Artemisia annua TaxID=35608 RepID=A0A2U1NQ79_ARTAN|nr:ulp1 protease family, C-terminal catalytic domain-containing protein [Artemisia annua]